MPDFILEIGNSVERRSVDSSAIVLGRDPSCDIVINDGSVSRQHAKVEKTTSRWLLKDLNSGNGVFVDGNKVRRVVLTRGSQFSLGESVTVTFLSDSDEVDDAVEDEAVEVIPTADLSAAPAVEGYELIESLGQGPRTQAFSYRKAGSSQTACMRLVRPDIEHRELEKLISDWNEVDHEAVTRLDLMRSSVDESIIRERYSEFGTLSDFSAQSGRMDIDMALKISRTLAVGLNALHEAGVRLGRLRPEKIRMTSKEGGVRISGPTVPSVDPRKIGDEFASHLSCMAPEFFDDDASQSPTRRGDIFALGSIMHQLFVGVSVGEGKTVEGMERSIKRGLLKTPDERRKGLPVGLSDLICACLSQDQKDRPLTASDVSEQLNGMLVQAVSRAPSRPVQATEREMGQRQAQAPKSLRHRSISWGITAILFLLINGAVFLYWSDELGIFGESDSDLKQSGPLISDLSSGNQGGLFGEIERLADVDHFQEAFDKIEGALNSKSIQADEANLLRSFVNRKRDSRILRLTERIERSIKQSKRENARVHLTSLLEIVGPTDSDYQRLRKQVEGN